MGSTPEVSVLYSIGILFEYIGIPKENWEDITKSPYQAADLIENDGYKRYNQKTTF